MNSARDGKLKLLNVDSDSLRALNKQCEDLVAVVLGLIKVIEDLKWARFIDLANDGFWRYNNHNQTTVLASMRMLLQKIHDNSTIDLVDVLKNHQAIITDMANTFINADKQYSAADGQSAVTFTTPGANEFGGATGAMAQSHRISGGEWMNGTFSGGGGSGAGFDPRAKDAIGPTIESGSYFVLKDFANIADMFERADGFIWDLAGTWHQIGSIWGEAVESFRTNNRAVFKNQNWQGAGAENAVKYLDNYIAAGKDLQKAILAVSTVLADTGDFGLYCYSHLPRYSQMTFNDDDSIKKVNGWAADKDLAAVRTWWDGHEGGGAKGYVDGLAILAGMVPAFTDPSTSGPSGGGSSGGSGGGSGGNGGGGSGDGTGGGSGDGGGSSGSGSGGGEGSSSGGGGGPTKPSASMPHGNPFSSSPTGPVDPLAFHSAPTGPADALSGTSGPLSTLANMLQQLSSGMPTGPLSVSGPWDTTGPWLASGPWGASGPFGFNMDPAGVGGGAGGGGAGPSGLPNPLDDKLFPRAGAPGAGMPPQTDPAGGRAGPAVTSGMPMGGMMGGMPMGGGMGGAQAGQQKERKRAAYLDGKEHLDEAVGEDPLSVRPIIDR
ncbi:hypothetical protein GFY24_18325 [Nocardia sp. SYP-A9097]|uniref:hypothetical protein n=1 Tax=Nocardia sp. SYP-A9097 TaxID=2663237 RepID=UPI00129B222F|nr:hypothetical protein [Nocardia sp. SYP-A9097]MRH89381.1 hypothetical protein [Nocardia sp. SYP-A9097]